MIKVKIRFSPDHLTETMLRHRSQKRSESMLILIKVVALLLLIPMAVFVVIQGSWLVGLFFFAVSGALLFSHQITYWWMRRSFLKSPYCNEEVTIEISEAAFHVKSANQDTRLFWHVFTKVLHLQDGVLLFQGPGLVNWIPFSCLENSAQKTELESLLQTKVVWHERNQPANNVGLSKTP